MNLYFLLFNPFTNSCLEKSSCFGQPFVLFEYNLSPISFAWTFSFLDIYVGVEAGVVLVMEVSVCEVLVVLSLLCLCLSDSLPSALVPCLCLAVSPSSALVLCDVSNGVPWKPCARLLKNSCEGGSVVIFRVGRLWFVISSLNVSLYEPGTATFTEWARRMAWNIVTWVLGVSAAGMFGRFVCCAGVCVVFLTVSEYSGDSVCSCAFLLVFMSFFLSGHRAASVL